MKSILNTTAFIFLMSVLQGCEVIGGIFKTGVGVGIFIAVVVVIIIVFIAGNAKK